MTTDSQAGASPALDLDAFRKVPLSFAERAEAELLSGPVVDDPDSAAWALVVLRAEVARLREREKLTREALAELERIRLSVNKQYPSSGLHGTADFLVGELMSGVLLTFAPLRAALASSPVPSAPQEGM